MTPQVGTAQYPIPPAPNYPNTTCTATDTRSAGATQSESFPPPPKESRE